MARTARTTAMTWDDTGSGGQERGADTAGGVRQRDDGTSGLKAGGI